MRFVLIQPPKFVTVERDGHWYPGELRCWRRDVDGWIAHVLYRAAPGIRYLDCVSADRVLHG